MIDNVLSRGSVDIGGDQWIEAEFFDGDDKLCQFTLVSFDHMGVCASNLLQLVLQFSDDVVLAVLYLLD